ncbi:MAG: 3D domain-containing protein [Armatimonadota bacterium]
MDKKFSDYRQAVRRFRQSKKRKAKVRLVSSCLAAYATVFVITVAASRGTNSQTSGPQAAAVSVPITNAAISVPAIPKREIPPPKEAAESWDRNIHALPSRGDFKRFYRVTATAYRPINTRMEGGRWTVTERDGKAVHGVAVDPDIIPLGSRLWIPGYGHAVADDIGGWIKGHRIDIRCQDDDSMDNWGRRKVRVYVLEDPDETAE